MRALAVAAIALASLGFSLSPFASRFDSLLLDAEWGILKRVDSRPAPDDIVIVGIDEASAAAIPEPQGLWHAAIGRALATLAAAQPRAIALDYPLPERSYDAVKPGVDRALFDGLASAVESAPFVAALNIDPRNRGARTIHKPYLALLGESRLGLSLVARDADGVARRYSLDVPTEDGGFPTIEGRLCRLLKVDCSDGLIHFALGKPYTYIPLKKLLEMSDTDLVRRIFRNRIVLIGETQAFSGRIDVPVNLAAWETEASSTPGIVLRAQTLRTALARAAPRDVSRPLAILLVSAVALVVLVRDWRMTAVTALVAGLVSAVVSLGALRAGVFLPLGALLFTLLLAVAFRAAASLRTRVRIS